MAAPAIDPMHQFQIAPLGGIIVGLVLDNVFDTLPWITIGLMFLAFAGACLHVVRINKNRAK